MWSSPTGLGTPLQRHRRLDAGICSRAAVRFAADESSSGVLSITLALVTGRLRPVRIPPEGADDGKACERAGAACYRGTGLRPQSCTRSKRALLQSKDAALGRVRHRVLAGRARCRHLTSPLVLPCPACRPSSRTGMRDDNFPYLPGHVLDVLVVTAAVFRSSHLIDFASAAADDTALDDSGLTGAAERRQLHGCARLEAEMF